MASDTAGPIERWTAKRRVALVLSMGGGRQCAAKPEDGDAHRLRLLDPAQVYSLYPSLGYPLAAKIYRLGLIEGAPVS